MAEQKSRIYSLPEITEINDDMYLMLDASDTGARRFNLKTFYDKVDGVQASADAANTAATAAAAAVDSANQAAQQAASAAESASTTVQGLVEDVNEAIEAVGDMTELAVPTMSPTVKGGAKLGTGLEVSGGTLFVNTVSSGNGPQAGPILSLSAKGWAEQSTTTGKNLCPRFTGWSDSNIAFTVNADGSITVSGTAVGDNKQIERQGIYLPAGVYTISGCPSGGGFGTYDIFPWDVTTNARPKNESGGVASSDFGSGATFVVVEGHETKIVIRAAKGYTVNNLTFYPQLELGSTATEYEPYTCGAPSPSPDCAQEIRVCSGRNLLDTLQIEPMYSAAVQQISTGVRIRSVSDGTYRATRTSCSALGMIDGITYTLRAYVSVAAGYGRLAVRNSENVLVASTPNITSKGYASITFTYNSLVHDYISLFCTFDTSSAGDVSYTELQLERGSIATSYVPYGYVGLEAQGKNLFKPLSPKTHSGITMTIDSDGYYVLNGTATATSVFDIMQNIPAGTYTVSANNQSALSNAANTIRFGQSGNEIYPSADVPFTSVNAVKTVTLGIDMARWFIRINSGQTLTNFRVKPQLEKGTVATPYQPYYQSITPVPLPSRGWVASLPDGTADTLTLDGAGKVTWEEVCEEAVFDGDESWLLSGGLKCRVYTTPARRVKEADGLSAANGYCTHFPAKSDNETYNGQVGFSFHITNGSIGITPFGASEITVADFKTWLSAHPITILYPLATTVTEGRGYIEMPEILVGAELRIPELDDLGVKYCVDGAASELARMWYRKAKSEYAEELMELRVTVNELATRIN